MPLLPGHDPQAIARAADALAAGELVALPTETVYGLGARADDDAAVARIFQAKGRPSDHPLIVHVADAAAAAEFSVEVSPLAQRLMQAFWPGPLTVIVPRRPGRATAAAGGQDTIGLRCPAHPVAHALLQAAAQRDVHGVAAPSANRFGRVSPTTAQHVVQEFGPALLVLDGGACPVGIESTIVDCTRGRAVLLRPGVLTRARIEAAAGETLLDRDAGAPRASGTLAAHYAPHARVVLLSAPALAQALAAGAAHEGGLKLAVYSRTVRPEGAPGSVMHRVMPQDAALAAQELFSVLRDLDARGAQLIWVEQPPDTPEWDGVRDRLQRAAAA
ncbi:MAG: L-threonylcarbamoyladenylate synthase [Pseudomonadota bacterium]